MNTRSSRSLFGKFRLISWLTRKVLFAYIIPLRGAAVRIVRAAVLFFIDAGQSSGKWGVLGGREKWARSCDLSVSEKMGRRIRKKKWVAKKRKCALGLNSPHSKGCWVFIYSGRGHSTFDYSTVTSRNPLQLLEHPRF